MRQLSENKRIFIASIINYVSFGINILVAIFYTPFLLNTLGDVNYGIKSFATSFVMYSSLIGSGISAAYLRFANIKKNEFGEDGVRDVDGVFFKIFFILGIANFLLGLLLFLLFYFQIIPLVEYTREQIFVISCVVFLSFITVGIKMPSSVLILIINFKRRFIYRNLRYLLSSVFEYVFSFVCLLLGLTIFKSQVIMLSAVSLLSEIIFSIITFIYLFLILKHRVNFKRTVVKKTIWKDIIKFSILSLLIVAVMSLNDSTDRIILGFISPTVVTFYSLAIVFNAYIKTAVDSVSVLYIPRLTEEATSNSIEKLQHTFDFVSKICTIILSFIVFGFICCGKEFIVLWLGKSREEIYYYSIPLLVGMVFLYPQHFSVHVQRAYGKQKFAAIALLITFALNVFISIALVWFFRDIANPALGCIIGTLFTYFCETIILSIYNNNAINIKQNEIWKSIFINLFVGFTISILVIRAADIIFTNNSPIVVMFLKGITYICLFALLQLLINKKELFLLFKRKKRT